ncbi:VOC family protein [Phyllobacterium sp. TAF24]|jgi:predicted 3-demethylubiquinone-9 3-methyltransferase (glyoxalase superfamily)|uniref:VOC family protein n=1 Tax=unclassified Phyllobacterium TaxID=2638441 RepID=UPI00088287FD|nr:VOC family protein [Phyllobacterium sp. OV277]SDO41878.1 Glyoxalase superfamily enzyme, possibly 3-demethylubiquinone-9 3-methyltransferase [Phyllobacterium sp. OV277]
MTTSQKIRTFLWFDKQAEEAANFYVSLFKDSKIVDILRPAGSERALTVVFQLGGQEIVALNGGPQYKFTEAISLTIDCASQEEVDYFWEKLSAGGEERACGWLKDKYGLFWQVVPSRMIELLQDKDPGRAQRAMNAMMQMVKIDIATIEKAADGE